MDKRRNFQMKCIDYSVTFRKRLSLTLIITIVLMGFILFNGEDTLIARVSSVEYSQFIPFTSTMMLKINLPLWLFWGLISLSLLFFLAQVLFWICYCGWNYAFYRYLVYGLSWFYSKIRLLLTKKWTHFILLYTLILLFPTTLVPFLKKIPDGLASESIRFINKLFRVKRNSLTPESLLTIFVIAVIISFIIRMVKISQKLVITEFIYNTKPEEGGKEEVEKIVQRIPTIFHYEYNRVIYLLRNFEAIKSPGLKKGVSIVEYTTEIKEFKTDDSLVGSEMNIKIGSFVNIPLGGLIKMFSRLLQGSSLGGNLYKEGNNFVLIGFIRSWKYNRSWRVYSTEIDEPGTFSDNEIISKMTKLLAWRILAELVDFGSLNWKAVVHYFNSLFYLRESQLSNREKLQKLQRAKKEAEDGIKGDDTFSQCYYNLGSIFLDLEDQKAAEEAFRKAIELKPDYHRCYYELAKIYFFSEKYPESIWFCRQALDLMPTSANYWNFLGAIDFFYRDEIKSREAENADNQQKASQKTIRFFLKASTLSWKALCALLINPKNESIEPIRKLKEAKESTALCLRNLAVVSALNKGEKPESLFKQALFLNPCDCDLHFEMGRYFIEKGKQNEAYHWIVNVFEDNQEVDKVEFWLYYLIIVVSRKLKNYNSKAEEDDSIEKELYKKKIENISIHFLNAIAILLQNSLFEDPLEILSQLEDIIDTKVMKLISKIENDYARSILSFPPLISDIKKFKVSIDGITKGGTYKIENTQLFKIIYQAAKTFLKGPFEMREWFIAQQKIRKAKILLTNKQAQEIELTKAAKNLEEAIFYLKKDNHRLIISLGLNCKLAETYLKLKKYGIAIIYALYAERQNPFGPEEMTVLKEAYVAFKTLLPTGRAITKNEFPNYFPAVPDKKQIIGEIGDYYLEKIKREYSPESKKSIYLEAVDLFENAKKIFSDEGDFDNVRDTENEGTAYSRELGQIYYYMGLFARELKESEKTILYFRQAVRYNHEMQLVS